MLLFVSHTSTTQASKWLKSQPAADVSALFAAFGLPSAVSTKAEKVRLLMERYHCAHKYRALINKWRSKCAAAFVSALEESFGAHTLPVHAWEAMVHLVQPESGSAVRITPSHVLTCAHCITHEDDPHSDEDEEESDTGDASSAASAPPRIGLYKLLLFPNGLSAVGRCTAHDPEKDLALLTLCTSLPASMATAIAPVAATGTLSYPCPVVCVGNPHDFDLESPEDNTGTAPALAFEPPIFHTSVGAVQGKTNAARADALGLGGIKHNAWTYWGHSGAPLLNKHGHVVALHNTWDGDKGTRHGVGLQEIHGFLAGKL